jgi:hypothetical protein
LALPHDRHRREFPAPVTPDAAASAVAA